MKEWLKKTENKILTATIVGLGVLAFWNSSSASGESKDQNKPTEILAIDTLIPAGFVLVPIQISNAEPLSSLVGTTAVVDLFTTNLDGSQKGKKIGSRLKLIRAPKNPLLYAVMVKDNESEKILSQPGPYFAVIQNHQQEGAELKTTVKNNLEISYQR